MNGSVAFAAFTLMDTEVAYAVDVKRRMARSDLLGPGNCMVTVLGTYTHLQSLLS
jgi:hypothetical protein